MPDINQWRRQLNKPSGNLTTNAPMPERLAEMLLEENHALKDELVFTEVSFPKLENDLDMIQGLNLLAGLQTKSGKQGCLTLFRAMRFPTYKRMHELVYEGGYTISNYEQERILDMYKRDDYLQKREAIKSDPQFWTQPQERVVHGLPLFSLVNDALQIHRAYRGEDDLAVIVALHIPHELFEMGRIKLVANTAIDLEYTNNDRDFEIHDFKRDGDMYEIDYSALRVRGIDLHEMYTRDLPLNSEEATALGITQDFYLLNIYRITDDFAMHELFQKTDLLKANRHFMHGFFGDQNIFGRRKSYYLPYKCQRIERREHATENN
jgi:hypothetical protein